MVQRMSMYLSSTLLILLSVALISAQSNCTALLSDALDAVEGNCGGTGRNEACYGYDQVEASFLTDIDVSTFSQPQDTAPVAEIASIRTAPLNTATGTWGVAIMNIQADLPNTLPGQNVTFILMGDVEVENAVAPENAFQPGEGIEVLVASASGANIRSGPGTNFNVIGGAALNETLLADGLSEDGAWLRVAYRERPAWVNLVTIQENAAIADLPALTSDLQTPMQAFYLRTGIGQPECEEAPGDLLLVQGPDDIEISITVNGADISLGSSGALRIIEIDGQQYLEIIVFDGHFTTDGQTITAGQHSILCLGDPSSEGLDGEANDQIVTCEASIPENIPPDEFGETWCVLEDVPEDILNYSLEVLCPGETPPTPEPQSQNGTGGSNSQLDSVDCSSFAITTQTIIASDFVLSWTAAIGADEYHVAVFDSGGTEISTITGITGTSIGVNGGQGFAASGSVHVRAFRNGQYACVATLGYANRVPDPNEPVGGYDTYGARLIECRSYGGGDNYSVIVAWSGASAPVTIATSNASTVQSGESGSYELYSFPQPGGVQVTSGTESNFFACNSFNDY